MDYYITKNKKNNKVKSIELYELAGKKFFKLMFFLNDSNVNWHIFITLYQKLF
jgi:hypothetical protein